MRFRASLRSAHPILVGILDRWGSDTPARRKLMFDRSYTREANIKLTLTPAATCRWRVAMRMRRRLQSDAHWVGEQRY